MFIENYVELETQTEGAVDNVYVMGNYFTELIKPLKVTQHNLDNKVDECPIHMLSQKSLEKEWLSEEENTAWEHL